MGRAGSSRGLSLEGGHLLPVFSDGCPSVRVWVLVSSKTPGLRDQATLRPHVTPFKARSPDTVTLGGWASAYEFWGETVQSTALCIQTADVSNTSSWKVGEAEGWSFPMELSRLQVPAIQSGERRASESTGGMGGSHALQGALLGAWRRVGQGATLAKGLLRSSGH